MTSSPRCDLTYDGHDCSSPGACLRAAVACLERAEQRRLERSEVSDFVVWPDDPRWTGTENRAGSPN